MTNPEPFLSFAEMDNLTQLVRRRQAVIRRDPNMELSVKAVEIAMWDRILFKIESQRHPDTEV